MVLRKTSPFQFVVSASPAAATTLGNRSIAIAFQMSLEPDTTLFHRLHTTQSEASPRAPLPTARTRTSSSTPSGTSSNSDFDAEPTRGPLPSGGNFPTDLGDTIGATFPPLINVTGPLRALIGTTELGPNCGIRK
jgi:beta-lactam-binding protein with PASTA domain